MRKKSLKNWINNEKKKEYQNYVIQDRFLDMNYFWFMEQLENRVKNGKFRQAKERCIDTLSEIQIIDEMSRIKNVVYAGYMLICDGKKEGGDPKKIRAGCDVIYDTLMLPFTNNSFEGGKNNE